MDLGKKVMSGIKRRFSKRSKQGNSPKDVVVVVENDGGETDSNYNGGAAPTKEEIQSDKNYKAGTTGPQRKVKKASRS